MLLFGGCRLLVVDMCFLFVGRCSLLVVVVVRGLLFVVCCLLFVLGC